MAWAFVEICIVGIVAADIDSEDVVVARSLTVTLISGSNATVEVGSGWLGLSVVTNKFIHSIDYKCPILIFFSFDNESTQQIVIILILVQILFYY